MGEGPFLGSPGAQCLGSDGNDTTGACLHAAVNHGTAPAEKPTMAAALTCISAAGFAPVFRSGAQGAIETPIAQSAILEFRRPGRVVEAASLR
jgi:hypothetical protein